MTYKIDLLETFFMVLKYLIVTKILIMQTLFIFLEYKSHFDGPA